MDDTQLLRYSRQILLPEVDINGQERLLASKVLVIGMGGLGAPVTLYLAAAGIGQLTLVDFDTVDLSNLQRQVIHSTATIGQLKVDSAAQTARALNPNIQINTIQHKLEETELLSVVSSHDAIVDCSDNFPTRFALNRACKIAAKPLISGAVIRLEGQITTFDFRQPHTACYRCLYTEDGTQEDTCSTTGILAPLAGIIGSMQAAETLKALLDLPTLSGRLLLLDAKQMRWRDMHLTPDPDCPICALGNKK
ncbi:HesA/MoeB/ThiF family protein [Thiothrix subterranea]|uniref:Molybdopterin-synthase adenylyltransferase n=1 Tax=Thiothrix subterranea TaxID=2735563 RepID=A0AA51MLG0_9GAMM|nr:molybdopterin-synthase adenylyltransferase MoeB [Thiothrix subterranea]MDQ5770302.1 molybdopterin-synthase adenylyltransferase MoeB [Thiothrix subterranea]WML85844.1 molybdopterin-synthase adenylyltransferase MoeB [Thiothrix subterranea]